MPTEAEIIRAAMSILGRRKSKRKAAAARRNGILGGKMKDDETKLHWMETRTQEVSQYYCTACEEIFQFASDKNGTNEPPVNCPMCGRKTKSRAAK